MQEHSKDHVNQRGHYGPLIIMSALSFVAMYGLMYAMVDTWPNVLNSLNQVYMAGLMTGSMVILELVIMRKMYRDTQKNLIFWAVGLALLLGGWFGIRAQAGITDRQFLRSMIPHHAGAILMCDKADLTDPEVKSLCEQIRRAQVNEIAQMKQILDRLDGKR